MNEQPDQTGTREHERLVSVVMPFYNEEENVQPLYERLSAVAATVPCLFEFVCVENGSVDATQAKLRKLAEQDSRMRVVILTRNFGYQGAICAGLEHARGDVVIVMDGDQQDPPELIPNFLKEWQQGYLIVYGTRTKRKATPLYRAGYKLFYRLFHALSYVDMPLDASDFALMDRRVVDVLNRMPERDRLIRGLRAYTGFRHTGVPYERPARLHGVSHFSFLEYVRFAQRSIFSFSYKPLELISFLALCVVMIACVAAVGYVVLRLLDPTLPRGFATLIVTVLFLGGMQLLALAIIGEYVGRLFAEVKQRPLYIVAEECSHEERAQGAREKCVLVEDHRVV